MVYSQLSPGTGSWVIDWHIPESWSVVIVMLSLSVSLLVVCCRVCPAVSKSQCYMYWVMCQVAGRAVSLLALLVYCQVLLCLVLPFCVSCHSASSPWKGPLATPGPLGWPLVRFSCGDAPSVVSCHCLFLRTKEF